jgi:hypothetical protein
MTLLSRVLLACVVFALLAAAPATAQSTACTPQSGSDEEFQQEIARSWLPFRVGVDVARASCRVHEFFDELLKRKPDPDKVTLDDVMESSKPDVGTRHDASYDAQRARMPSPTTRPGWNPNPTTSIVVLPPSTPGGTPVLFQPNAPGGPTPTSVAGIQGNGTLLSADGMKRGNFVGGSLNGVGEEIDPDGTWRSGTYDRGTNTGQVFEVRSIKGKTYLVSGSVVNGKLDGMIERIYADGSTQFEDWEGGKLMQVGVRAPKGQTALAPQTRYKPPVEVATEDAYKHTLTRSKFSPRLGGRLVSHPDCFGHDGRLLKRIRSCITKDTGQMTSDEFRRFEAAYAPKIHSFCPDIISRYFPTYPSTSFPLYLPCRGCSWGDLFPLALTLRDDALLSLSQSDLAELRSDIVAEQVEYLQKKILEYANQPYFNEPITQKEMDLIEGYAQVQICAANVRKSEIAGRK